MLQKTVNLLWLVLLTLTTACSTLTPSSTVAEASSDVRFCLTAADGPEKFYEQAEPYGINCATVYWRMGSGNLLPSEHDGWDDDTKIILVIKFPLDYEGSVYEGILNGAFDDYFRHIGENIENEETRIASEFNGNWYNDGARHPTNNFQDFIPAYCYATRKIQEAANGDVWFDLNYNRNSAWPLMTSDFEELYPGTMCPESIQSVSISSYNRCGSSPDHTKSYSFAEQFAPAYETLTAFLPEDMPINVAETATTKLCAETQEITWYDQLLRSLETGFPRTEQINLHFTPVEVGAATNRVVLDWPPKEYNIPIIALMLDNFRNGHYAITSE